ncbi:MAG: hypothetical protein K0S08_295 [Gammaproteobacteria bacterium]|jgi:hypothetical protein|nr:hypothetical protein [Gammaproteobacteria bacterium]
MLPEHCQKLLDAALSGAITTQDEKKTIAVSFYEHFEYTGDPSAAFCLAELYRQGIGGVAKNAKYATYYYSKLLTEYPHPGLKALAHCGLTFICAESEVFDYTTVNKHYLAAYELRNSAIGSTALLDDYLQKIYERYIHSKLNEVKPQDCEYYLNRKMNKTWEWRLKDDYLISPKLHYDRHAPLMIEHIRKIFPFVKFSLENDSKYCRIHLLLKNIQHEVLTTKTNTSPTANINDDVLSVIFSKLPAKDQASASIVCQQWRQAFLLSGVFQIPTEQQLKLAHEFLCKNSWRQSIYDINKFRINYQPLALVPGKPHLVKIILDADRNVTSKREAAALIALGREDEIVHSMTIETFCSSKNIIELANYQTIIKFFQNQKCEAQILGNGNISIQGNFIALGIISAEALEKKSHTEHIIAKNKISECAAALQPFVADEVAKTSTLKR